MLIRSAFSFPNLQVLVLAALLVGGVSPAMAQTKVLVNPGDQGEQSRVVVYMNWKAAIEQALRKGGVTESTVQMSTDATADLGTTRARIHDIYIAPAHVVGSAVRYGYTPVLGLNRPLQAVLVAPKDSPVGNLAQAAGKRLGMPQQDSLVTYLVRGELNAANTTLKRHFSSLYETRYQEALLPCLQVRRCDVVAVERALFDRWIAAGEPLKLVMESKPAPAMSVAIKDGTKPGAEALRAALVPALAASVAGTEGVKVMDLTAKDFSYVSTLGYFTPRSLPGATVVDASAVAQMLERGARYIDTRTDAEFKAGHVGGAKLIPYVEKSAKDADFNPALDQFDVAQLGTDRAAPLIFACNGAECWKSFKASTAAIKAGFTKVHWFRGGFPEWRASGMKAEVAAAP
ncbi:MAG TPA: rhodanese-like domain-containing protein [Burkholderiaceae bacterium]|nr:rhodanese-like domain-containing protein [Burkholderiaceae bacterium]